MLVCFFLRFLYNEVLVPRLLMTYLKAVTRKGLAGDTRDTWYSIKPHNCYEVPCTYTFKTGSGRRSAIWWKSFRDSKRETESS